MTSQFQSDRERTGKTLTSRSFCQVIAIAVEGSIRQHSASTAQEELIS